MVLLACDKGGETTPPTGDNAATLESRALRQPLEFRLTAEKFAIWQIAQDKLDALERDRPALFAASPVESASASGEDPIDAGVARLEANPYARSMIEATGISVRDYVVTTLALAQAAQAAIPKNRNSYPHVSDENIRFVLALGTDLTQIRESTVAPPEDRFDSGDGESDDRYEDDGDKDDDWEERKPDKREKRGKRKGKRD